MVLHPNMTKHHMLTSLWDYKTDIMLGNNDLKLKFCLKSDSDKPAWHFHTNNAQKAIHVNAWMYHL